MRFTPEREAAYRTITFNRQRGLLRVLVMFPAPMLLLFICLQSLLSGIPLGIWLHSFVMRQLSFDMVSFHVVIHPLSFVIAVVMTFVFAFGVDLFMRPRLGKINMVESLKAIE